MYFPQDVDKNDNRIEDIFEEEVQRKIVEGNGTQLAKVVALLDVTPSFIHTRAIYRVNKSVLGLSISAVFYALVTF